MKNGYVVAALITAMSLAACGGGGGSSGGGGVVTPPTHAPTAYTVKLRFSGGDQLSAQAMIRAHDHAVRLHPYDDSGATTGAPIEMSQPGNPNSLFGSNTGNSQGVLQVVIQPQPSTSPQVTVDTSGAPVTTQPLAPPSSNPTNPPAFAVDADPGATPAAGTLTATESAPVGQSQQSPLYIIPQANIACSSTPIVNGTQTYASDNVGGIAWNHGTPTAVTDQTQADLYLSGPSCTAVGFYDSSESGVTLHAPYGAVSLSSTVTPFYQLMTSMWQNAFTSEPMSTVLDGASALTPIDEYLVKTADGHIVKIALQEASPSYIVFGNEENAYSQDGF